MKKIDKNSNKSKKDELEKDCEELNKKFEEIALRYYLMTGKEPPHIWKK